MKKTLLTSFRALCAAVMTVCAVSCYDDSDLNSKIDDLDSRLSSITAELETLKGKIEGLYTLSFKLDAATSELLYSFDNDTYKSTGVILKDGCKITGIEENDAEITIHIGDQSFTIVKPQEIEFEIRAGKVYFASEGSQIVAIKTVGVNDLSVIAAPKGWWAEVNASGQLEITAPNVDDTESTYDADYNEIPAIASPSGYVKVHACAADGSCLVGRLLVEVASKAKLTVQAYGENLYIAASTKYSTFYYGVSTRETLDEDAGKVLAAFEAAEIGNYELIDALTNVASSDVITNFDGTLTKSIAEVYGSELQKGVDYVVWALDQYDSDMNDLVMTYYNVVDVNVVEDETKKTAFDTEIAIAVDGADSYVALALPSMYIASRDADTEEAILQQIESFKEGFIQALPGTLAGSAWGSQGKIHYTDYSGSLFDVCEGTMSYMGGYSSPLAPQALFILPIDGRPTDKYTVDDVRAYIFYTSSFVSGGKVDATVTRTTEIYGEALNPKTELGATFNVSDAENWSRLYTDWLTDAEMAALGGADAKDQDVVDWLIKNCEYEPLENSAYGNPLPYSESKIVEPGTTLHCVAFAVDNDGKYGKVTKLSLTSEK